MARLQSRPARAQQLTFWLRELVLAHAAYFIAAPGTPSPCKRLVDSTDPRPGRTSAWTSGADADVQQNEHFTKPGTRGRRRTGSSIRPAACRLCCQPALILMHSRWHGLGSRARSPGLQMTLADDTRGSIGPQYCCALQPSASAVAGAQTALTALYQTIEGRVAHQAMLQSLAGRLELLAAQAPGDGAAAHKSSLLTPQVPAAAFRLQGRSGLYPCWSYLHCPRS